MFQSMNSRRLFVWGFIIIIFSLVSLFNTLFTVDFEQWMTLFALALNFLLFGGIYLIDRELYAAIGAYVMLVLMALLAMTSFFMLEGAIIPSFVLAAIALPFILVWALHREKWGMLIPAYILLAIIPIFYMEGAIQPELIPAYVLTMNALPFLAAFVATRKWSFLVPSGVLLVLAASFVGIMVGIPPAMMSIGLPLIALVAGLILMLYGMSRSDEKQKI